MQKRYCGGVKKALITGITGQDGSYLAELLLEKGYHVYGLQRRASLPNTSRVDHLYDNPNYPNFYTVYGDLADSSNLAHIIARIQPDEIYNLGAQSHVRVSFDVPEYTANITGLGAVRILEALRHLKFPARYYQASSSEMFGKALAVPQNETTPFNPQSPYGISKTFAFWVTRSYREGYTMFAANGILFNHETISSFMPMFYKNTHSEILDIKPICEIVSFNEVQREYQSKKISGLQVWGKNRWVDVMYASAYPHDAVKDNKRPRFINGRSSAFMATASHVAFMEQGIEKEVGNITVGDRLETINLPPVSTSSCVISEREAELMGMMVGDGSITYAKKGIGLSGKFTNSSCEIRNHFTSLWKLVTGGTTVYYPSESGFKNGKIVGQLRLAGGNDWLRNLDIYNRDRTKRVPRSVLNASVAVMFAFLKGYNMADGLKENLCTYEFRNFKTNSATLAMGLWFLIERTTHQDINLTLEAKNDGRIFYSLNILSPVDNTVKEHAVKELVSVGASQRGIARQTGISRAFVRKIQRGGSACLAHHLKKNHLEVKKIIDMPQYSGWFYDLETSSGEFHCGVGKGHVHNSPRRGITFVTRKTTIGLARVKFGLQKTLALGNLDAKRDWGFSKDYVEAIWRIVQHDKPDDFVIATGETHTVREFTEEVGKHLGMDIVWEGIGLDEKGIDRKTGKVVVEVDPAYFRPTEVDLLLGDSTKARAMLGWEPKVTFKKLAHMMAQHDYDVVKREVLNGQQVEVHKIK